MRPKCQWQTTLAGVTMTKGGSKRGVRAGCFEKIGESPRSDVGGASAIPRVEGESCGSGNGSICAIARTAQPVLVVCVDGDFGGIWRVGVHQPFPSRSTFLGVRACARSEGSAGVSADRRGRRGGGTPL